MPNVANELSTAILDALRADPAPLLGLQRGIEKESLRVGTDGVLSQLPHPEALGSALTHPHITTDFSEAQLELITDVHDDSQAAIEQLEAVHRYVYLHLDEELLWTSSMPCLVGDDRDIPVGRYGTSNIATAKTVYRLGLGNRYGRLMQTISGIHYNFSVPDSFWEPYAASRGRRNDQALQTEAYFGLIRNFRRLSWLLIYLFGASPAICKSFVKDKPHALETLDEGSLYLPYATSLRMGRLGYQSDAQSSLHISYNSLDEYAVSMRDALTRAHPAYRKIGVKVAGEYRQLNAAILQIENEFYGTVRPKRPIRSGERPLTALEQRGVEYVEVRCLDLNPFLPLGIDSHQSRFIDLFLLYCLLLDSPPDSRRESQLMQENQLRVVEEGRRPDLHLVKSDASITMTEWAGLCLDGITPLAELLDAIHGGRQFSESLEAQGQKLRDPDLTPSARILEIMRTQQIPFFHFALNQSIAHKGYFDDHPLPEYQRREFEAMAAESLRRQHEIEAGDQENFEQFLEHYLAFQ